MESSLEVAPMMLNARACDLLHGYGGDDVVSRKCNHQHRLCRCRVHATPERQAQTRNISRPKLRRVLTSRERGASAIRRSSRRREKSHNRYGWMRLAEFELQAA
jgi:hypothetical protein